MRILPILFNYNDLKKDFPNRKTFESFLARSLKEGKITQIRRGLYGLNDPSTGLLMASKFQIASRISSTSFISYHLAMEYYGLSEQSFSSLAIVSSSSRFHSFTFSDVDYQCALTKNPLFIRDRLAEEGIRIVSVERMLVDSADRLDRCGGFEELSKAVSSIKEICEEELFLLLKSYGSDFLYLKIGYLLEQYFRGPISEGFFSECLRHRSRKKYYFGAKTGNGVYQKKWNLIVPSQKKEIIDALF